MFDSILITVTISFILSVSLNLICALTKNQVNYVRLSPILLLLAYTFDYNNNIILSELMQLIFILFISIEITETMVLMTLDKYQLKN